MKEFLVARNQHEMITYKVMKKTTLTINIDVMTMGSDILSSSWTQRRMASMEERTLSMCLFSTLILLEIESMRGFIERALCDAMKRDLEICLISDSED